MEPRDPKLTALLFNDCINRRDLGGLTALMTPDHTFIDSAGEVERGREAMTESWREFFRRWPDYRNHFARIESRGDLVVIEGHSTCSCDPLSGPALWTARVRDDLVAEWCVHADTPENRQGLGLA
ncbi:MAG: nuclear transport factor 2 family protein [Planctomycetota bacterium]